jgi:hypothetical protein
MWNPTAPRTLGGSPARVNLNAVILPTGEIFISGGIKPVKAVTPETPMGVPDLCVDPALHKMISDENAYVSYDENGVKEAELYHSQEPALHPPYDRFVLACGWAVPHGSRKDRKQASRDLD